MSLKYSFFALLVLGLALSANAVAPTFTSASDSAGTIKGGTTVTITTVATDSGEPVTPDTPLKLYVCKAADATSTSCGAGGTYCSDVASATNPTCNFVSETDSAAHTWYAYLFDSNSAASEAASNNPLSDSYTTDSTLPSITLESPANSSFTNDTKPNFGAAPNETVTNCYLQVDDDSAFGSPFSDLSAVDTGTDCDYTDSEYTTTAFTNGQVVYWRMKGKDSVANDGNYGSAFSFTIDTTACNAVANLDAFSGSNSGQIGLSWGAPSCAGAGISKYIVYRHTEAVTSGNKGSATVVNNNVGSGSTSFTDTPPSSTTSYYYAITTVDAAGTESDLSNSDSATPAASGSGLNTTISSSSHPSEDRWYSDGTADFTWNSVGGATYYYKFNSTSDSPVTTSDKDAQTTSTSVSGMSKTDGIWYFHLVACTSSSNCGSVDHYTVRIDTTTPNTVSGLTATANSNGTVLLDWDAATDRPSGANSDVDHYDIYRHREAGFHPTTNLRIGSSETTGYTDASTSLENGATYFYKIAAIDGAGNVGDAVQASAIVKGATGSSCNADVEFSHDDYIPSGRFDLVMTSDGNMVDPEFVARLPSSGKVDPINLKIESRKITATLEIGEQEEDLPEITLTFKDSNGKACTFGIIPAIDGGKPQVEITAPEDNDEMAIDELVLKAEASDANSGIKNVKFYYKKGGTYTELQGDYSTSGDETTLRNIELEDAPEEIEVKAIATDGAGNTTEETITLSITGGKTEYGQDEYTYSTLKIRELLEKAGLDPSLVEEARKNIIASDAGRKLEIILVDGEYTVSIIITATNDGDEPMEFKIVEFIPKSFAGNANQIESDMEFTVLQSDPVIEFEPVTLAPGETRTISYSLKDVLTKEEADALIDGKVIDDFAAPPAILNPESEAKVKASGLGNYMLIIIVAIVIVAIVIIGIIIAGAAYFLHRRSGPKGKLGKMGPMESISGELHRWFEDSEIDEKYSKKKSGKFSRK